MRSVLTRAHEGFVFRRPKDRLDDLRRSDCLAIAIQTAFPLPRTGTFSDLLLAIDEAELKGLTSQDKPAE